MNKRVINSASILLIGNELLNGDTRDKNAWYLSLKLSELGIKLVQTSVVADDSGQIINELNKLSALSALIFTCGGIGPTSDDLTREAISEFAGVTLEERPEAVEKLKNYAAKHNRPLNKNSFKQALFPQGSEIIPNRAGTADCFLTDYQGAQIITLPGVPSEIEVIFEDQILERIPGFFPNLKKQYQRSLRLFGLSESYVGTEIDKLGLDESISIAYRPSFPELLLVLSSGQAPELENAIEQIKQTIGKEYFHTENKKQSLAMTVFELLKSNSQTIAAAESCSGGMIANSFVSIPGASSVFLGSAVTYSNESKQNILGIDAQTINKHGAVSEILAREMAAGAQRVFKSSYALSITGIAGPDGGTENKPVGTIVIGLASPTAVTAHTYKLSWERERNRVYSVVLAQELLRRKILNLRMEWERK